MIPLTGCALAMLAPAPAPPAPPPPPPVVRWDAVAYQASPTSRVLRVRWGGSGMLRLARVAVREESRRVVVTVLVHRPHGAMSRDMRVRIERVRLRRPLGDRVVVDGGSGRRLPRSAWVDITAPLPPEILGR